MAARRLLRGVGSRAESHRVRGCTSPRTRVPDEGIDAITQEVAAKFQDSQLPGPNESAAIALKNPKTAALAFDCVWAASPLIPSDIGFRGNSDLELRHLAQMWVLLGFAVHVKKDPTLAEPLRSLEEKWKGEYAKLIAGEPTSFSELRGAISRSLAVGLFEKHRVQALPVLESEVARRQEYTAGDFATLATVMSGVQVVDESTLSWDQVRQFRSDAESRRALRRMMHWLDATMVGKPVSFVEDEVSIRLQQYEAALKKHGLQTVVGTMSALLDSSFLVSATAASGVAGLFTGGVGALIAGGSLVIAKAAVHVSKQMLDTAGARATTAGEIAFVIEAQKLRS